MPLKNSVLEVLRKKENLACVLDLAKEHEKSFYTIQEWTRINNPLLSTPESLNIISVHLNLDSNDILESIKETA